MSKPIRYRGYDICILPSEYPMHPRQEFDNLSRFWFFHPRWSLGDLDTGEYIKSTWFDGWYEMENYIVEEYKPVVIRPVSLLDHSGLYLYIGTGPHETDYGGWDSMRIGFMFVAREDALREFNRQRISEKLRKKCEEIMLVEFEVYRQYLEGDVWCYEITRGEDEFLESCCGFYGYDYCLEEAKAIVDSAIERRQEND